MANEVRLVLGNVGGQQVFRITRPGYDAMTESPITNPKAFSFASDWDRIDKILEFGRKGASGGNQNNVITADPGFIPAGRIYPATTIGGMWVYYDEVHGWVDSEDDGGKDAGNMFYAYIGRQWSPTSFVKIGTLFLRHNRFDDPWIGIQPWSTGFSYVLFNFPVT